jgi:hypothetical protein
MRKHNGFSKVWRKKKNEKLMAKLFYIRKNYVIIITIR